MREVSVDLLKYADLSLWKPKVGDVIFNDGIFLRWFAVICAIENDVLYIRKSGNMRLLVSGEYEETKINVRKIKNSMIGSYIINSENTYFV